MQRVDRPIFTEAYEIAKGVYTGVTNRAMGLDLLSRLMNGVTAAIYMDVFMKMMSGEVYKRTMNIDATEYYLEKIHADFGSKSLRNALIATNRHVEYYQGITDSSPEGSSGIQRLADRLTQKYGINLDELDMHPDEVDTDSVTIEGATVIRYVNRFERSKKAREECVKYHKAICAACGFDFKTKYGDLGIGFIEVHHLVELSRIKKEYVVDPKKDLVPLCSNCHSMIHRVQPALTLDALKKRIGIIEF